MLSTPPVDPHTIQQAPSTTAGTSQSTATTTTTAPTNDKIKVFLTTMEKWETVNDVAAGLILGSLSTSVELMVDSGDHVNVMYNKLEAHALKKSSGTSALAI